jgi:hypothetical protein
MPRDTAGSSAAHETCTCTICGRVYEYDRRKGHTRRSCNSCGSTRATREERLELKERMLAYKGGRCTRCGFDSWPEALGFHHLDKANKRFPIAGSHGRRWETLRRELDKCMVVCLNCHAEIHDAAVRQGITRWNRDRAGGPVVEGGHSVRTCATCGRRYAHNFRKGHTRRICNSCRSNAGGRAARQVLKGRMVDYKGGRCEQCGYRTCLRALCFHHLDPSAKRFTIASSHLRRWESLCRELDRCVLLCHNCHAGVHGERAVTNGLFTPMHTNESYVKLTGAESDRAAGTAALPLPPAADTS